MKGYTHRRCHGFRCLVRDDLAQRFSDAALHGLCRELFAKDCAAEVVKRGTYKTLLKKSVIDTSCIVKKYRIPGLVRKLKSLVRPTRPRQEFAAACFISSRGIPTAAPLLLAEHLRLGLVREGLVVMPFIAGAQELRDFLFYGKAPDRERKNVLSRFGALTAKIFGSGIFQYDYALNNFLVRREQGAYQCYFIDFEKVLINRTASREQKLDILSRLNRVGREVSVRDRMIFLRGYLAADPGIARSAHDLARELQQQTIATLRSDLERRRLTSIYTHARYDRIQTRGYTGLCKKGYAPDEIVAAVKKLPPGTGFHDVELMHEGSSIRLRLLRAAAGEAAYLWSILSTFIIAGAPLVLPHLLLQDNAGGFLGFETALLEQYRLFLTGNLPARRAIERYFPRETEKLLSHISGW